MGQERPIVFLHGNPTSFYLWRDVMPELSGFGRCIAPDLIGMGDSAKLPDADAQTYDFATLARYFSGFMGGIRLDKDVLLVAHNWRTA